MDDAVMRPLMVLLGAFGLVAGLACALVLQSLPVFLVGQYSWFVFGAPDRLTRGGHISIALGLFPSVVVLPVLGLIVGLVAAVLLGRAGWALARSSTE